MSENISIGHKPEGKWAFDESVAVCFDDMLERSIPQYNVMRRTVADLALRYVQPGTSVVDLGCSQGGAIELVLSGLHDRKGRARPEASFVGIEVSPPMLAQARARFRAEIERGIVSIERMDLRDDYPAASASVTLSVLTLQFVPIEHRLKIVRRAYQQTVSGGVFILVEKVLGATAEIDAAMVETYYDMKHRNGYSQEEIDRKRLALEGVLVPVTARWNEEILRSAGFQHVDCFWRWCNFSGWIAVKDPL
jgi:tRNA (cmo5U34)-methyltransferase